MKDIVYSFERYEKKYFITESQKNVFLKIICNYIKPDEYGKYTVCNIYYDTDDWRIIRTSLEKPVYKEKLRVRSYGTPAVGGTVFAELKKKYKGIVYKRRITAKADGVEEFLNGIGNYEDLNQIGREIYRFQEFYKSVPKVFIGYDRTAFSGSLDGSIRITFDTNIRWRNTELDLRFGDFGSPLLTGDGILMEIKTAGVYPLWLAHALSDVSAFPCSFSKYGTCYNRHLAVQNNDIIKEAHFCA